MGLKYVYAGIIFSAGFILGYFVNNKADTDKDAVVIAQVQTSKQTVTSSKKANPFELLSTQQNKIDTQENSRAAALATEHNAGQLIEENTVNDPEQAEVVRTKLAEIGYLVKDNELDKLASGLGDSSAQVRKQTILGLGDMNSAEALQVVGQALISDPAADNRMLALTVLEKNQNVAFVTHFLTHAMHNDKDSKIRQRAARALGQQ
jgi:HEAT repeat protein